MKELESWIVMLVEWDNQLEGGEGVIM